MQEILKFLPSVKSFLILAALCAAIVFGFKDTFTELALAGKNESLSLIVGFLLLFFLFTLGITAYYAIAKKEIQAEADRSNIATVKGSKKVKAKQKGTGGQLEVTDSEEVELEQDSTDQDPGERKKKA